MLLRQVLEYIKPTVLYLLFFGVLFYIDSFIMEPYLGTKYLDNDIIRYEKYSWKYSLYIIGSISIILIVIRIIVRRILKTFLATAIFFSIYFGLVSILTIDIIGKVNLVANTWFTQETFQKEYKVYRNGSILSHSTTKEMVLFRNELNAIEKIRKEKKLPSIYNLKDGDTINISFSKGYLDIKYLRQ